MVNKIIGNKILKYKACASKDEKRSKLCKILQGTDNNNTSCNESSSTSSSDSGVYSIDNADSSLVVDAKR